jgi:hypothetical protein
MEFIDSSVTFRSFHWNAERYEYYKNDEQFFLMSQPHFTYSFILFSQDFGIFSPFPFFYFWYKPTLNPRAFLSFACSVELQRLFTGVLDYHCRKDIGQLMITSIGA